MEVLSGRRKVYTYQKYHVEYEAVVAVIVVEVVDYKLVLYMVLSSLVLEDLGLVWGARCHQLSGQVDNVLNNIHNNFCKKISLLAYYIVNIFKYTLSDISSLSKFI